MQVVKIKGAPFVFLAAVVIALPMALGLVSRGEGRIYDLLLRACAFKASPRVVLVAIDDATFKDLGNRNPTRAEIALAAEKAWDAGADLVAMDLLFDKERDEAEDSRLEEALSKVDCVLACSTTSNLFPIDRFRKQAVGLGSIDLVSDDDGVVRSMPAPAFEKSGGELRLSVLPISMECALLTWYPEAPPVFQFRNNVLKMGEHSFPIGGGRWMIPYCGGDGTLPRFSMIDLLRGDAENNGKLKGKIVLIGNTRPTQHDLFSVPVPPVKLTVNGVEERSTNTMAGVEIQGQALSAMLEGYSIRMATRLESWFLYLVLAVAASVLALLSLKPFFSLVAWSLGALLVVLGCYFSLKSGIALPLLGLVLTWCCCAAVSFSHDRYRDYRDRQAVSRLFARYVSPNIAKTLLDQPDLVHLGGKRKELSILFSDIRGFTSLSEKLQPEEVSGLLNEYFTEMTEILFNFDGTLDKFIGDAVLAFFGDPVDQPDHAERAVACAVRMQEKAAELRERFRKEGKPELHIGIAVHTGPVIVGNNGSVNNFMYTVIGDAVNLASRLQGLAVKDDVILSAYTASLVNQIEVHYNIESCEPVRVKGKREPVEIVRVLSPKKSGGER